MRIRARQQRALQLIIWAVTAVLVAGAQVLVLPASPAAAAEVAAPEVSDTLNEFGYPAWYQDRTGTRLEACLDPGDPFCVVDPVAGVYDPSQPQVMPSNFPDEHFYTIAASDRVVTPGCGTTAAGRAHIESAIEAAFGGGVPAAGDQMVFGRVRLVVTGGLCPGQQYTATHPYGQITFVADEDGSISRGDGTNDVGCVPGPGLACDFALALDSRPAQSFLRWDPAVAPAAPAGYLGDATTLHPVVGGTFDDGTGPVDSFTLTEGAPGTGGAVVARTDLFTVSGKVAGPVVADPEVLHLIGQQVGTTGTDRPVTFTNLAADPVAISTVGTDSPEFVVTDDGCSDRELARDETCTVRVAFGPATTGDRSATLTLSHDDVRSPVTVGLTGTGTNPAQEPGVALAPDTADFGDVRARTESDLRSVTVTNTGTAPLEVSRVESVDVDAGRETADRVAFRVVANQCASGPVAPGASCTISVAARPFAARTYQAALKVSTNAPAGPREVALRVRGTGGLAGVSSTIDGRTGFPEWYQADNGVRLVQCIDTTDPRCILDAEGGFDPANPVGGLPDYDNFPGEYFYSMTTSDMVETPGCAGTEPGKAFVRGATEAAFANEEPVPGDQMVFGRVRISVSEGLCPDTDYTITHPWGRTTLRTDADGALKKSVYTTDIGCFPTSRQPCDFSQALASPVLASYVRWDPAVAPAAPAGYLGDTVTPHAIVGAPYTAPGDTVPANFFRIEGPTTPGGPVQTLGTTLFTVMGKLAGPLTADAGSLDFGRAPVGSATPARPVLIANDSTEPVRVGDLAIAGAHPGDFAVDGDDCTGRLLAPGERCTAQVHFAPTATAARGAELVVNHVGGSFPLRVRLAGIGESGAGQAAISASPGALRFTDLHTGEVSAPARITVSNVGGSADLHVQSIAVSDPDDFFVTNGCSDPVAPEATCPVDVVFTPRAGGPVTGTVTIGSNAGPPVTVLLTGRGFTGSVDVGPVDAATGFPLWYQDDNGVRVEPCLDAADPACILAGSATFDPARPVSLPGNFPDEVFYQLAESDVIATPGCQGTPPGTASVRATVQGGFTGGVPATGQQLVMARVRVEVTSGLCPLTPYTFTTPYGEVFATTDEEGGLTRRAGTADVGCATAPCDFSEVLTSPNLGLGLLRWDPNAGAPAPEGYLGDGTTLHRIVGSRVISALDGTPANHFAVDGPGAPGLRTDLFTVTGRLARPVTVSTEAVVLDDTHAGTTSSPATVTLTNQTAEPVGGFTAQLAGADAAQFAVAPGGTCGAGPVAPGGTCTVLVAFTPTAPGARTAQLAITSSAGTALTVELRATALEPVPAPAATVDTTTVAFGSRTVGTTGPTATVAVRSTGTGPLTVTGVRLIGPNPGDFTLAHTCGTVAVGATCDVTVRFTPTAAGHRAAVLEIASDDPAGPITVALSGTATAPPPPGAPKISLSESRIDFGERKVNDTRREDFEIRNTGDADLAIYALSTNGSKEFTVSRNECTRAIAPGRSCKVEITFRPSARGTRTGSVLITSNAGWPVTVPLTGRGK